MKRFLKPLLIAVFLVFFTGSAFAASLGLDVDSITFNAEEKEDVLGAGYSRTPDGRADASFNLAVSGAQAIKEISLKNETTGKMWSTSQSGSGDLLIVKDSSGNILNPSGRLPVIPVLLQAYFKLYINDAESAIPKDSNFTVIVTLIDNKDVTGKTSVKGQAQPTVHSNQWGEGISLFEANGIGQNDYAGRGEKVGADGRNDHQFTLDLNFNDTSVRAVRIIAQSSSGRAEWDTVPGNNLPIITVVNSGNNIMNRTDGSVSFGVNKASSYTLLVQDTDGILADSSVKAKITISLSDGRIFEKEAVKGKISATNETFSVEYKGTGKYDFVGSSEKIESNLDADRQIDVAINISGTLTGVRVKCLSSGHIWDTRAGNGNPLVVLTDEKGSGLNKNDGTISLALNGAKNLSIWFDEEDYNKNGPYLVTFVMSNGQVLEASTTKNATTPVATKKTLSVEYKGAGKYDFVGSDKKIESNGNPDRQINAEINVSGNLTGVRVKCLSSGHIWDTTRGNDNPIVVLTDEKGSRQNRNNGTISMELNGARKLYLWFDEEDDNKNGPYLVTFMMSDGQVLEASTTKTVTKADRTVVFTTSKPTIVNVDLVGKNKKLASNGAKDMALNVKISGKGIVKSLVLKLQSGKGWDTLTSNNGRWLLGVRENGKVLNNRNGTVSITVNGTKTYQLLIQDHGELAKKQGKVYLAVTWGDGEVTESSLKW